MAAMRLGWIAVVAVALATLLAGIGRARLWDRDEPRNARCAVEMWQRGDWIVPTFNGELRTHKPILLYWMQIAAFSLLGISEWSARLPSALSALGTVLLTSAMALRLLGPRGAAWAGVTLASCLMFVVAGRAATPDGPLIFCQTLAVALFVYFALVPEDDPGDPAGAACGFRPVRLEWPRPAQWWAIYAACGLGVLAKGPVGLVLPLAVIGLTATVVRWEGRATSARSRGGLSGFSRQLIALLVDTGWKMRPLSGAAIVAAVALPWYAAVGMATEGAWLRGFFFEHNLGRALRPMEGHSGPGPFFYLGALLAGTFPWSVFAVPLALVLWQSGRSHRRPRPVVVLCVSWIAVYLAAFSPAATKLPSYITPCYPGVAILLGWFLSYAVPEGRASERWMRRALGCGFVAGIAIATAFGVAGLLPIDGLGPLAFFGTLLASASVVAAWQLRRGEVARVAPAYAMGAVGCVSGIFAFGPPVVDGARAELDAVSRVVREDPEAELLGIGGTEPSWVFYAGSAIPEVPIDAEGRWLESAVAHLQQGKRHYVIVDERRRAVIQRRLAQQGLQSVVVSRAKQFLEDATLSVMRSEPLHVARERSPGGGEASRR